MKPCTRCGAIYDPPVPVVAPPNQVDELAQAAGYTPPARPQGSPNMAALIAVIALVVFVNLGPALIYGLELVTLLLGVGAGVVTGIAAYNLWKQFDLFWRGVKVDAVVTAIDFVPDNYRNQMYFDSIQGGKYFAHAVYTVDGIEYTVRSEYGTITQQYEVGMAAPVWYDPASPALSVLGSPKNMAPLGYLAVGIGMTCLNFFIARSSSIHFGGQGFFR